MGVKDRKTINVLNYNQSVVVVSTRHDNYTIEPAIDSSNPTSLPLSLDEILYINGNSNAFKSGLLRFEEDIQEEMYMDFLRIPNWKDLLTVKEIEEIIINPTVDGLNKLISIKDDGVFGRVRGIFIKLKNTTNDDISLRVEKIINARSEELRRGIRNTQISIQPKDTISSVSNVEVDLLKQQNEALQQQMAQMQEMMAQMLNAKNEETTKSDVASEEPKKTIKKPGRPKKA